ncbi:MAG: Arm DNA-binding domain-containing protein, partial [Pseudomonadota bacterium]
MPAKRLTDAFVRSAAPLATDGRSKLTEYADTVQRGLSLRVTAQGAKSWTFRYRTKLDGKQRRMSVGKWPDVTLAAAREAVT